MTSVVRTQSPSAREFIGRAWINTVTKEGSKVNGTKFIQVRLDRNVEALNIKQGDAFQLWPNQKREGKQDADYRMSLLIDPKNLNLVDKEGNPTPSVVMEAPAS